MMHESNLEGMTLLSWTLQIWRDHRRGLSLTGQPAVIAHCMQQHSEWWSDWDSLDPAASNQDPAIVTRLLHIHNDATILSQISNQQPKEVHDLYEALREKGFTEFESIHAMALAMSEETARARARNEPFDYSRYIENARVYVAQTMSRPNLTRLAKAKTY
ncbi:MAG: DUF1841 family protein [Acidobacteria bacterium]|nr:DUF1841 family protein [Acidobacteriota bacterium]